MREGVSWDIFAGMLNTDENSVNGFGKVCNGLECFGMFWNVVEWIEMFWNVKNVSIEIVI